MIVLASLISVVSAAVVSTTPPERGGTVKAVSVAQVQEMLSNGEAPVILDVRTPAETASETGFIPGSLLVPLQDLERRIGELEEHRGKLIVVYCRTQNRSAAAAHFLAAHGFDTVYMTGGIVGWNRAGNPVEHVREP